MISALWATEGAAEVKRIPLINITICNIFLKNPQVTAINLGSEFEYSGGLAKMLPAIFHNDRAMVANVMRSFVPLQYGRSGYGRAEYGRKERGRYDAEVIS